MRTSLICLKWLGIKIIIYQPYSSTSHLSKLVFSKTNKVVIFHFEVMITNIVYILKTYFFLLYFILFSDLLCPLFMHTFWHLVIDIYINNNKGKRRVERREKQKENVIQGKVYKLQCINYFGASSHTSPIALVVPRNEPQMA